MYIGLRRHARPADSGLRNGTKGVSTSWVTANFMLLLTEGHFGYSR